METLPEQSQIENDLCDWLRREIFDESVELNTQTDLLEAGFDSMSLVRLFLFAEKQFNLEIPEEEITEDTLKSVQTLSRLIRALLERA